jgi:hypothetical protein
MLHVSRHEHGVGTLRIHCGSASQEDMLMVIAPFVITYHKPQGTKGMPALGGRGFKVKLTTVKFNEPDWPAIPNGKDKLNIDDQNNLVAHAKDELKQSHAPLPVTSRLRDSAWPSLPYGSNALPRALGQPERSKKPSLPPPKPRPPAVPPTVWPDRERETRENYIGLHVPNLCVRCVWTPTVLFDLY